jgi:hypothetical protein
MQIYIYLYLGSKCTDVACHMSHPEKKNFNPKTSQNVHARAKMSQNVTKCHNEIFFAMSRVTFFSFSRRGSAMEKFSMSQKKNSLDFFFRVVTCHIRAFRPLWLSSPFFQGYRPPFDFANYFMVIVPVYFANFRVIVPVLMQRFCDYCPRSTE